MPARVPAFEEVYVAYFPHVLRWLRAFGCPAADLDDLLHRQPTGDVLFWGVTRFGIHHPVCGEVEGALLGHPVQTSGRLHDRDGVLESLQIAHERARIRALPEPLVQRGRVRARQVGVADLIADLDDRLRPHATVEVVVQEGLGCRGDIRADGDVTHAAQRRRSSSPANDAHRSPPPDRPRRVRSFLSGCHKCALHPALKQGSSADFRHPERNGRRLALSLGDAVEDDGGGVGGGVADVYAARQRLLGTLEALGGVGVEGEDGLALAHRIARLQVHFDAGPGLHNDLSAEALEFLHRFRRRRDAGFTWISLGGNSNAHERLHCGRTAGKAG